MKLMKVLSVKHRRAVSKVVVCGACWGANGNHFHRIMYIMIDPILTAVCCIKKHVESG